MLFPNTYPSTSEPSSNESESIEDSDDFMNCVVKVIFKIAYCYPSTRDICYKDGNSLMFAICSTFPKLIGTILNEIDLNLEKIGK